MHPTPHTHPAFCRQGNRDPEEDSVLPKVTQLSPPGRRTWLPPDYHALPSTSQQSSHHFCLLGTPQSLCTCHGFYEHSNSRLFYFMKIKTFPSQNLFLKKSNALKMSQDAAVMLLKWHCPPISINLQAVSLNRFKRVGVGRWVGEMF